MVDLPETTKEKCLQSIGSFLQGCQFYDKCCQIYRVASISETSVAANKLWELDGIVNMLVDSHVIFK